MAIGRAQRDECVGDTHPRLLPPSPAFSPHLLSPPSLPTFAHLLPPSPRYATRTHGAYVKSKGSSMLFNFIESDPEYGEMQGKELQTSLQHVLAGLPVVVRTGKGYVEACHQDVNKGAMAARMIDVLQRDGTPVDFVLCAGDDSTDELMFTALHEKMGKKNPHCFTVTVGRKPSEASRYLDDHNEVVQLLELLGSVGFRAPGTQLGAGGGMGMRKTGGMGGGMGNRASFNNLADLG